MPFTDQNHISCSSDGQRDMGNRLLLHNQCSNKRNHLIYIAIDSYRMMGVLKQQTTVAASTPFPEELIIGESGARSP
jgi:hypothetical protein